MAIYIWVIIHDHRLIKYFIFSTMSEELKEFLHQRGIASTVIQRFVDDKVHLHHIDYFCIMH